MGIGFGVWALPPNEFLVAAAAAYHTDNQTEAMNARDLADVSGAYARLGPGAGHTSSSPAFRNLQAHLWTFTCPQCPQELQVG